MLSASAVSSFDVWVVVVGFWFARILFAGGLAPYLANSLGGCRVFCAVGLLFSLFVVVGWWFFAVV